ncbi:MAG: class I SAM-dependent methyltransferase, partial [Myxococcota bacterium]
LNLPKTVTFLEADLANEPLAQVLERSPLPRGAPIAIAWEGVSMYLERGDVEATLTALADFVGPGSRLVFDLWRPTVDTAYHAIIEQGGGLGLRLLGEPLRFACHANDAPALLEPTGWRVTRTSDVGTLARARGRVAYPDLILVEATIR